MMMMMLMLATFNNTNTTTAVSDSEPDERATITNDVQSSGGRNGRRSIRKCHTLEPLSMLERLGNERQRRQTTDDVESAQTSPSCHRRVSTERKLSNCTQLSITCYYGLLSLTFACTVNRLKLLQ